MIRRLIATSVAVALLAVGAPANAGQLVVDATDKFNDVKLLSDDGGLTLAQRQSIDFRRIKIIESSDSTRFKIALKQVLPNADFDQMVFVTLTGKGVTPVQRTDVGLTAQNSSKGLSYANYTPDTSGEDVVACDPLDAKVRKKQNVVFLDVPHSCLPDVPVKIKVLTVTGFFRAEGVGYSRDTYVLPGTFEVK
jgi:hypothetical protein